MQPQNWFKSLVLIVCMLTLVVDLNAQSKDQSKSGTDPRKQKQLAAQVKKAETEYKALRFLSAMSILKPVVKTDTSNVKAVELLAGSYRNLRDYAAAMEWYGKLSKVKPLKPETALYYAEALANNERYEESEKWYRVYLSMVPADKRASSFIRTDPSVFSQDKGEWKIAKVNLNTAAAEYSPVYYKKGLLFVSNRYRKSLDRKVFAWDQTPYSDFYVIDDLNDIKESAVDTSTVKKPKDYKFNDDDTQQTSNDNRTAAEYSLSVLEMADKNSSDKVYPLETKVNSKFNDGPGIILPDGTLIFTRNNFFSGKTAESSQGYNKLQLYFTDGDSWNSIRRFDYNNDEYSSGHPSISKDGQFLVFASDMPGGFGGSDLYYCVRAVNGKWGRPVNMGTRINTEGNEMFPYMDKDDKLFFSSTGYAGLGGLDIFEVTLKDLKPAYAPRNLGAPFNSSTDDFGLIKSADGRSGYFSSNREGNDDIYSFRRQGYAVNLRGTVVSKTNIPVSYATVYLSRNGIVDTVTTDRAGQFTRPLDRETEYQLVAEKPGYVRGYKSLTTVGIKSDTTLQAILVLGQSGPAQQFVINKCDSLKRIFTVPNIYYDLDRSEIRPDAQPALDRLAAIMKQHPEVSVITASHCDSRASSDYNKKLSLRRGRSAKSYLIAKGIDPSRIAIEYFGKTRLVNNCYDGVPCSEDDQQMNRRTEFDFVINDVNLSQLDCSKR